MEIERYQAKRHIVTRWTSPQDQVLLKKSQTTFLLDKLTSWKQSSKTIYKDSKTKVTSWLSVWQNKRLPRDGLTLLSFKSIWHSTQFSTLCKISLARLQEEMHSRNRMTHCRWVKQKFHSRFLWTEVETLPRERAEERAWFNVTAYFRMHVNMIWKAKRTNSLTH